MSWKYISYWCFRYNNDSISHFRSTFSFCAEINLDKMLEKCPVSLKSAFFGKNLAWNNTWSYLENSKPKDRQLHKQFSIFEHFPGDLKKNILFCNDFSRAISNEKYGLNTGTLFCRSYLSLYIFLLLWI